VLKSESRYVPEVRTSRTGRGVPRRSAPPHVPSVTEESPLRGAGGPEVRRSLPTTPTLRPVPYKHMNAPYKHMNAPYKHMNAP
jgi:hypothetical protein